MSTIKSELERTKNRLEESEERLEVTKGELAQAEKRFDRSKSVTLGSWINPGSNIFGSSSVSENDKVYFFFQQTFSNNYNKLLLY